MGPASGRCFSPSTDAPDCPKRNVSMLTAFRSAAARVAAQILGLTALLALVFITGCGAGGGSAQFAVTTTSGQLATIVINAAYPQTTLTAANGTAPYTWTVTSGALPAGMALSTGGVISGTPTAFGTFAFTVTVTDSATPTPHTATASLDVLINPAITTVSLNPATVPGGTPSTGTVTLSGAAPAAAAVTLASSSPAATVPATVTVAAGQSTATFQVTSTAVNASTQATITATYGVAKTAALTVNPPTVASVALTLASVTGGTGTTGTLTLTAAAAAAVKVSVPVVPVPPVTLASVRATEATVGGFTVNAAVFATPYVAVIVACVEALTAVLVTWKVAVDCPAATVTVAGTVAAGLLLASVTAAAAGAAPLSVTVPVDGVPPGTVAGFKETVVIAGLISTSRLAVAV